MNVYERSYQPILRDLYTEAIKRHGEISLHKHFKKIDSYLENYKFALKSTKFHEILESNKHLTNFRMTNLKLPLSIQILCASDFNSVRKYASSWI